MSNPAATTVKGADILSRDNIELSLPVNPAYVSAARLTASSIANRIGFDADEIEDVKAAVSEACIFIIRNAPSSDSALFKVVFTVEGASLSISFSCSHAIEGFDAANEMGLLMIKALMDEMTIKSKGKFGIKIRKLHKVYELE